MMVGVEKVLKSFDEENRWRSFITLRVENENM